MCNYSFAEGRPGNHARCDRSHSEIWIRLTLGSLQMVTASYNSASAREFQKLKNNLHQQMVDSIDFSRADRMTQEEFQAQLRGLAGFLCSQQESQLTTEQRNVMVDQIMDEIYGFGPLEKLMSDPEVTDILVNGHDRILVERNGKLEDTIYTFADEQHLMRFIRRMASKAGRQIDESHPIVDARLDDGSRFNAVIPPLAVNGPTISIRRFGNRRLSIEDIINSGSLAPAMADFLILAVRGRMNVVISGGAGAGKTTLLNGISRFIPAGQRVVTIEETAELRLQQKDVISLETRPPNMEGKGAVNQRDLLKNALRMRPDRIIVGEARGDEVLDMLQAMNTGHDGSMSTVHANSAAETLQRLEMLIALSSTNLSSGMAQQFIANAVDIVIHMTRLHTGERRITRISEVSVKPTGEPELRDIFVYRSSESSGNSPASGAFFATGFEPAALTRLARSGISIDQFRPLFVPRELKMKTTK